MSADLTILSLKNSAIALEYSSRNSIGRPEISRHFAIFLSGARIQQTNTYPTMESTFQILFKDGATFHDLPNLRRRLLASRRHRPDDHPVPFNQSRQKPITRPAGFDEGFIVSEVKRYDCSNGNAKFCYGCYQMDENPYGPWVQALDFDAAQSELSALREENERLKSESFEELYNAAIDERDALRGEVAKYKGGCVDLSSQVRELEHKMDYWEGSNTSLQQRLTAAQQRNAELVELLHKARRSIDPSCAGKALRMELDAALKPTESGASE